MGLKIEHMETRVSVQCTALSPLCSTVFLGCSRISVESKCVFFRFFFSTQKRDETAPSQLSTEAFTDCPAPPHRLCVTLLYAGLEESMIDS